MYWLLLFLMVGLPPFFSAVESPSAATHQLPPSDVIVADTTPEDLPETATTIDPDGYL